MFLREKALKSIFSLSENYLLMKDLASWQLDKRWVCGRERAHNDF